MQIQCTPGGLVSISDITLECPNIQYGTTRSSTQVQLAILVACIRYCMRVLSHAVYMKHYMNVVLYEGSIYARGVVPDVSTAMFTEDEHLGL